MMPTSVPLIVAGIGRLVPDGCDLRTRTGNNRNALSVFLASDAWLNCSVRHRFRTLT
jgi:hypothetical protein